MHKGHGALKYETAGDMPVAYVGKNTIQLNQWKFDHRIQTYIGKRCSNKLTWLEQSHLSLHFDLHKHL